MNSLVDTLDRYAAPFYKAYGARLNDGHRHALSAIRHCRTEHHGELRLQCTDCAHTDIKYRSCGHRSCHRCQHHDNSRWLERQQAKLLPVDYFMVTFTLPAECRGISWQNQQTMYTLLFDTAISTCRDFAKLDKHLKGDIGLTAVLHTQTRRLDYHPHVHVITPAAPLMRNSAVGGHRKTIFCSPTKRWPRCFEHECSKVCEGKVTAAERAA